MYLRIEWKKKKILSEILVSCKAQRHVEVPEAVAQRSSIEKVKKFRKIQRCFPVNSAKFLRTSFLIERFRWQLRNCIYRKLFLQKASS